MEMLKVRAALEEKLKQKGVFSSVAPKHQSAKRNVQPLNGYVLYSRALLGFYIIFYSQFISGIYINSLLLDRQLQTLDDFDDNASDIRGQEKRNGHAQFSHSAPLSKIATRVKKAKVGIFYMVS